MARLSVWIECMHSLDVWYEILLYLNFMKLGQLYVFIRPYLHWSLAICYCWHCLFGLFTSYLLLEILGSSILQPSCCQIFDRNTFRVRPSITSISASMSSQKGCICMNILNISYHIFKNKYNFVSLGPEREIIWF